MPTVLAQLPDGVCPCPMKVSLDPMIVWGVCTQIAERKTKEERELEERRKKGIMTGREIFSQVRA